MSKTLFSPTASGSMTNPMTTGGDVIYGGTSGTPQRLANGSSGQVLKSSGGTSPPTWADTAISNKNQISLDTSLGYGSEASNKMRVWTNLVQVGAGMTFTVTASNSNKGDKITINTSGIYTISYSDNAGGAFAFGIAKNPGSTTTAILSQTVTSVRLMASVTSASGQVYNVSWTGALAANDVIYANTDGTTGGTASLSQFVITQVA